MLFSNDRLLPANQRYDEGIRRALDPEGNQTGANFFGEFLDATRLGGAGQEDAFEDYLKRRYRDSPPQVLVALGSEALQFFIDRRKSLFPDVPLVFGGVRMEKLRETRSLQGVAGLPMELKVRPIIEALLSMRPKTREIVLVHGAAESDRSWRDIAMRQCAPLAGRVKITDFPELSLRELKSRLGRLSEDQAVLYLTYFQGPTGETYTPARVANDIAATSAAPVIGPYDTYIGTGVLGVSVSPFEEDGLLLGQVIRRVLSGEKPKDIGALPPNPPRLIIDARQMKRWGIKATPKGAEVRFRSPSLWEDHPGGVIATITIVALQGLLIFGLLAARHRARETDASLSLAADAAEIGLWRRHLKSDYLTASPRWRKIFGLPATGSLPLKAVLDRLHPEDRERMTKAIEQAAQNGGGFSLEHRVIHPDGTVRWVASHGRSDAGGNSHGFGTRGASIDITERHEAAATTELQRQELAHLSRVSSLGVLSGALAHELNQPLGIILSNAQAAQFLLESDGPDLGELQAIVSDIIKEDRRAGNVIKRLRALLRRGETAPRPLDVNESVREVLRLTHSDLIGRGVAVTTLFSEPLPRVLVEGVQLQQVLLNLIINACDAMVEHDPVERALLVETFARDDEVCIAVRDRGVGLPDNLEELFQPFHTTKKQGLGMGLAICRTLVTAHGGRLWAEPNQDRGAVFFVALPKTRETS